MQSFKQYLLQEEPEVEAVFKMDLFFVEQMLNNSYYAEHEIKNMLIAYVKKLGHVCEVTMVDNWELELEVRELKPVHYSNKQYLEDLRIKIGSYIIHSLCKTAIDSDQSVFTLSFIGTLPKIKTNWHSITLLPLITTGMRLTKIDKVIECEELMIFHAHYIDGNVLSLLKMKNTDIHFYYSDTAKWVTIIKNHLRDRNIIACQEELFQNGLDEYAKL